MPQSALTIATEPAIIYVNCERMCITLGNSTAERMFAKDSKPLADRPITDALPLDDATSSTLQSAIRRHRLCTLPPALLELPDTEALVCQIHISPWSNGLVALQIYAANASALDVIPDDIPGKDTMAVLGLDQFTPEQGATPDAQLINTYRTMRELVRSKDILSLPLGQALIIRLRETTHKEARKICESMLSHLNALQWDSALPRYCIGLARTAPHHTPLQAVVEAYHALWQARLSGNNITSYNQQHKHKNLYNCLHQNSLYNSRARTNWQQHFLRAISHIEYDGENESDIYQQITNLCCEQPGIIGAALYRGKRNPTTELAISQCDNNAHTEALIDDVRLENGKLNQQAAHNSSYARVIPVSGSYSAFLLLRSSDPDDSTTAPFSPTTTACQLLATSLAELPQWRKETTTSDKSELGKPLDTGIVGYVGDNMEGAVDQAIFLANLDIPVAIIGPRGTGKMYIARTICQTWGDHNTPLITLDCRELRNRREADIAIQKTLSEAAGKTLVFKSPHLMSADSQRKLARQLSTRLLSNSQPPQYLPQAKYVALFPDKLERLTKSGKLHERLASVFAGYPIFVPPIKDRKQAVLRWGHKILSQECADRSRDIKGFTADAEAAMLQHDWPGNISEMRQRISAALDHAEKSWVTPVDLGIYKRMDSPAPFTNPATTGFLEAATDDSKTQDNYQPSALEQLNTALGETVHHVISLNLELPLGTWLEDEIIVAATERYRGENSRAARFLQTRARNISRWMDGITKREQERLGSNVWQEPRRLVQEWIREAAQPETAPLDQARQYLLIHLEKQGGQLKTPVKARIMGISAPTYQKRLTQISLNEHIGS